MHKNSISLVIKDSLKTLWKNPLIILIGFLLWLIINILSIISVKVNYKLLEIVKPESQYGPFVFGIWLVLFGVITFIFMAFIFSGIIYTANLSSSKKVRIRDFIKGGVVNWFGVCVVIIITLLVSILIGRVSHYIALYLGMAMSLEISAARILFLGVYFLGLIGFVIFFTFASFFVVVEHASSWIGLKKSFKFVWRHYVLVLIFCVILFLIFYLVEKLPELAGTLIEYIILVPLLGIIMTRMVLAGRDLP